MGRVTLTNTGTTPLTIHSISLIEELPRKPQGKVDKQKLAEGDRHDAGEG